MSEAVKNTTKKIFWTEKERYSVVSQALLYMLKALVVFSGKPEDRGNYTRFLPLHEAVCRAQNFLLASNRLRSESAIRLDCNFKNSLLRKTVVDVIRETPSSLFDPFELVSLGTGSIGTHLRFRNNITNFEELSVCNKTRRLLGEDVQDFGCNKLEKAAAEESSIIGILNPSVTSFVRPTPSTSLDSIVETLAANVAKSFEETLRQKLESVSADLVVSFEESLKSKLNDVSNRLLDEYSTLVTAKRNEISAITGNSGGYEVSAEAGKVEKERLCKVLVLGPIPTQVNALVKEFENCLDLRFASNESSAGRIAKQAKYVDAVLVMTDKVSHAMHDAIKKHPNRILCKGDVSALKDQLTGIYADYQA